MRTRALIAALAVTLAALCADSQTPPTTTTTTSTSQETIDQLRSLPYAAPSTSTADKTGVVANSRFAAQGYNFYGDRFKNKAALLTNDGRTVHTWSRPNSASWGHAELLPDGALLVIEAWDAMKKKEYPKEKGFPSRIVKLSPASRVEWISHIPAHHDIQLLRDGSFLTLTERRRKIDAVSRTHLTLDNAIAHVDAKGTLLSEISLYRAVSHSPLVKFKAVKPDDRGLVDLFHANSIQKFEPSSWLSSLKGTLYKPGNILFCSRHQDLIGIVSPAGQLLWAWGQKDVSGPHAARLLANGNILVFDNGLGRKASRVIEVDPSTNRIVWTYQAEKPEDFYSGTGGYSQRLPNGNTLITDSWKYTVFEVTSELRLVWKFVSPGKNFVYRLQRYPASYFERSFRETLERQ